MRSAVGAAHLIAAVGFAGRGQITDAAFLWLANRVAAIPLGDLEGYVSQLCPKIRGSSEDLRERMDERSQVNAEDLRWLLDERIMAD